MFVEKGVAAAYDNRTLGLIDNWLRHAQDFMQRHRALLAALSDTEARVRRLCELNVIEQAMNVAQTTIVQQAWERGQGLTVHGWIYGLTDGLVRDLNVSATGRQELSTAYQQALAGL